MNLFLSDLDGTLLRSDETLSDFTCRSINSLCRQGMLFSYATARSFRTASRVTRGLTARLSLIVYNGTLTVDSLSGEILDANFFADDANGLLEDLIAHDIHPIVYSFVDGVERFTHLPERASRGMRIFNDSRSNDPREIKAEDPSALFAGKKFTITCIDEPEKLIPFYEKYKLQFRSFLHRDIYSGEQWLEFIPLGTSKASAAQKLKSRLGCDHLTVFGDGINDTDLFRIADESCAVGNAVGDLKSLATHVIGTNNDDAVAKWLLENYK